MRRLRIDAINRPRSYVLIGLLGTVALGSASCVAPPPPPPAPFEFPPLPDLGGRELVVAIVGDNLPFSRLDDATGAAQGFGVDMITAVAAKLNLQPRFVALDCDAAVANLNAGTYDVVAGGILYTLERATQVDFALPLALLKQRLAVRTDESRVTDIAGFHDRTELLVGSVPQTIAFDTARDYFGEDRMRSYDTSAAAMDALAAGTLDGVVLDTTDFEAADQGQPGTFRALPGALAGNLLAYALQRGSDLTDPINLALSELQIEGTIGTLRVKWGF